MKFKQKSVILKLSSVYADGSRKISFAILEVSDSIYPQRFRLLFQNESWVGILGSTRVRSDNKARLYGVESERDFLKNLR
ncbi:hypothetical protein LEP1GSC038_1153 [Leptospira weilii str. 2006001855]|uniref:Uncharacterized protein n=1 Tax=Leptospira weilii str. 2006001855 TaxID=996804 RepID=M6FV15_9LEPT|nr:hypothetical protein LEP1GSC038_1153 [Leptospira weilii str. 2006001855]